MALTVTDFFFHSTPGYWLLTVPFAAVAGFVYWLLKYRKDKTAPFKKKLWSVLFVCYAADVVCMVFFFSSIRFFWGTLFLNYNANNIIDVLFVRRPANFIPDFYKHFDTETVLNLVLFLPFGILYPMAKNVGSWKKTVLTGLLCTVGIEALQPAVGRAFDINDMILNAAGVIISSTLFFLIAGIAKKVKGGVPGRSVTEQNAVRGPD